MKTSSSRGAAIRSFVTCLSLLALPLAWSMGCGNQREGERCDHNNGNDDCNAGLICKQSKDLGGSADICCPQGTSQNAECIPGGGATSSTGTGSTGTETGSTSTASSSSTTSSSSSSTSSSTSTTTSSSSSGSGGAGGGMGM